MMALKSQVQHMPISQILASTNSEDFPLTTKKLMPNRRTEQQWTRLTPEMKRAMDIRCAEMGIKAPEFIERAIAARLGMQSSIQESAETFASLSDDERLLVEEYVRMRRDPGEEKAVELFDVYLRGRMKRRQEAEATEKEIPPPSE